MFDYDFIDAVEKRFNNLYSYGGEVERSFNQNVGKIVNKQAVYETPENIFDTIMNNTEDIMNGRYKPKKRNGK